MRSVPSLVALGILVASSAACGDDDAASTAGDQGPRVVVSTNIVGDMVTSVLGDQADVEVIMPLGADPHDFAASARQAEAMQQADLVVVNGAGFEEGLLDVIETAEESGAAVFEFADHVDLLAVSGDTDPHIWTDPRRMETAVAAFAVRAAEIDGVDADVVRSRAAKYAAALKALDTEIEATLAAVAPGRRVLVTNHEVFGYFADRYGFEVIGAVIPSPTTGAEPSAADIEALAEVVRERGVPAIFGETTQPTQLAEALASEVGGGVEVVELFTESLGEPGSGAETYIDMMQLNAERIGSTLS